MGNQIPFLPRLIREGMSGNKFYYDQNENPYADSETGLLNCVTYAMGRSGELAGQTVRWELLDPQHKGLGHGMYPNAQLWYSRAHWAKGGTPKLGAILVFGGGQYGHPISYRDISETFRSPPKSPASILRYKKSPLYRAYFFKWCRHAELNCGFILTMDAYYHYTMSASSQFYTKKTKKERSIADS